MILQYCENMFQDPTVHTQSETNKTKAQVSIVNISKVRCETNGFASASLMSLLSV